ncbi:MAG: hypothetical protein PWQ18_1634 [Clostridia bacterium]|nr:hypothetical protein [Clostridia bacterium]
MTGNAAEWVKDRTILSTILASVQAGIVIIDCQARVVRINPFAERLFNIEGEKAIGKRLSAVIPASSLAEVLETGEEAGPVSERYHGRHLLARYYPLFNDHQKLEGALSIYIDVTEHEQVKQQLQEARQKERELEAILEHSHDGIWIMDGGGITLRVSKSWQDFSGIKREEVIGRTVYEIVAEGYYTDSAAIHVIEQRKPVTIIYRTRTGKKALVTATPVFGADGGIWRIISNVRDITELDQYRKELEKSQENNLRFQEELKLLRQQQLESSGIIARSQAMKDVLETAAQTAGSNATILVLGESGVGKDIVARFIHSISARKKGPFIRVNCGAIPETLMESELFGYEEGSFTGARKKGKPGMFELAQGGTLFLDEIGELPLQMQAKLLHVLQDRTIMRVGGVQPLNVDVRIIAATNQDLKTMVEEGKFRQDLYYRLNVIPLYIPPLRQRPDDTFPLLMHFLDKYNKRYNLNKSISSRALELLVKYEWPGNVRELENITERLVLTSPEDMIDIKDLPAFIKEKHMTPLKDFYLSPVGSLKEAREKVEKSMLAWALKRYGSTRKAAAALGVTQPTIVRLAHKYGLNKINL